MSAISSLSSTVSQPLSTTTPVTTNSKSAAWQEFVSQRRPEVQQLKDALQSGDLAAAQKDYNSLVALGNKFNESNPFPRADRALDFNAIGGALQNGDLAGAQQAFAALHSTFVQRPATSQTTSPAPVNLSDVSASDAKAVNVIA
ncbi:MAG TPA: hypothetical protein VN777_15310 [Terriglobales bacterium]|nr:hypothetical protein [Terriglobales bacterium]